MESFLLEGQQLVEERLMPVAGQAGNNGNDPDSFSDSVPLMPIQGGK